VALLDEALALAPGDAGLAAARAEAAKEQEAEAAWQAERRAAQAAADAAHLARLGELRAWKKKQVVAELKARALPAKGKEPELLQRLLDAVEAEKQAEDNARAQAEYAGGR
jgi:hypothetical protein